MEKEKNYNYKIAIFSNRGIITENNPYTVYTVVCKHVSQMTSVDLKLYANFVYCFLTCNNHF